MTLVVQATASQSGKTFLQLVQQLRQECGVSGANPITTIGQVAEINRLVGWAQQAWVDIQSQRQDWLFMRDAVSFQVTPDLGGSYTPAQVGEPMLAGYKKDSFRAYSVALGVGNEQILPFLPYDQFRNLYLFGANRSQQARPVLCSVDPQKNFLVGPIPNEPFIIDGEVFAQPQEFANDIDIPRMPPQFHMAIVYKAMMSYGAYENAPEVYSRGEGEYKRMLARLIIDQTPTIGYGASLA
jgi:hypothetical protein